MTGGVGAARVLQKLIQLTKQDNSILCAALLVRATRFSPERKAVLKSLRYSLVD